MLLKTIKRDAWGYWERRRILYNILLVPPCVLSWHVSSELTYFIDDRTPAQWTDLPVLLALVGLAVGANLCYSFVYALEFLLLSESPGKFWPRPGRSIILFLGCLLGMWIASVYIGQLQVSMAGPPLPYEP